MPIPNVNPATLVAGRRIYQREDCSACHTLADTGDAGYNKANDGKAHFAPDLTHEGQRNADIDWQMSNLSDHHRLYPNSSMPDYNDLPAGELRALASFMATRK